MPPSLISGARRCARLGRLLRYVEGAGPANVLLLTTQPRTPASGHQIGDWAAALGGSGQCRWMCWVGMGAQTGLVHTCSLSKLPSASHCWASAQLFSSRVVCVYVNVCVRLYVCVNESLCVTVLYLYSEDECVSASVCMCTV